MEFFFSLFPKALTDINLNKPIKPEKIESHQKINVLEKFRSCLVVVLIVIHENIRHPYKKKKDLLARHGLLLLIVITNNINGNKTLK